MIAFIKYISNEIVETITLLILQSLHISLGTDILWQSFILHRKDPGTKINKKLKKIRKIMKSEHTVRIYFLKKTKSILMLRSFLINVVSSFVQFVIRS